MLDYGIVGNCKTCALISKNGSVDWMCYPDFNSPSIFGKILDAQIGGCMNVLPDRRCKVEQKYLPNTNILETTFTCKAYSFRILDFMPRYKKLTKKVYKQNALVRILDPLRGIPKINVVFDPKPDYAQGDCALQIQDGAIAAQHKSVTLMLHSNLALGFILARSKIPLTKKSFLYLGESESPVTLARCMQLLRATRVYWQRWVNSLILPEQNRDTIIRSALTLKLMQYSETGAIIAAPTTSIPEELGTERTWDYRYCWIRDATQCVDALVKIGRKHEAKKLINFLISNAMREDFVHVLYTVHGSTEIPERILPHLSGFRNSKPVRIGNAAALQDQTDIFGELIDILYLYFVYYEFEKKITKRYLRFLQYLVNQIKYKWKRQDSSIWEFRSMLDHYTFSKLMCWVGVDRAIQIAQHCHKDDLVHQWLPLRDAIKQDILEHGYDEKSRSFTIAYGKRGYDAALLLIPYYGFLEPTAPRLRNTIKALYNNLSNKGLMQRYSIADDFGKSKSIFTICSFWLVQALYLIGEQSASREIYAQLMKYGNHLGLYSEDISLKNKRLLGNFPQAYTHIAIINTSILLSEWNSSRKKIDWHTVKEGNLL